MRVAIIHYWLVGMRGGEKVLEAICELYPSADIFTHVVAPESISPTIANHRIVTSFIAGLPRAKSWYKKYLPLMPLALEQFDLRGYDRSDQGRQGESLVRTARGQGQHRAVDQSDEYV